MIGFAAFGYIATAMMIVVVTFAANEDDEELSERRAPSLLFTSVLWLPLFLAAISLLAIDAAAARHRR